MYMKFRTGCQTNIHTTQTRTQPIGILSTCIFSIFVLISSTKPKMLHSLYAYVRSSWLTMAINNLLHCKLCSRYIVRMFWTRNTWMRCYVMSRMSKLHKKHHQYAHTIWFLLRMHTNLQTNEKKIIRSLWCALQKPNSPRLNMMFVLCKMGHPFLCVFL